MTKKAIFSGIVLWLFLSSSEAAIFSDDLADSLRIAELTERIHQFESQCYDSGGLDVSSYQEGMACFDQLIDRYVWLHFQHPESSYAIQAFQYLEKKKNLTLLIFLSNGFLPDGQKDLDQDTGHLRLLSGGTRFPENSIRSRLAFNRKLNIPDFQQKFLDDKQALLSYWQNENRLVVFILCRDSLQLIQWKCQMRAVKKKIHSLLEECFQQPNLSRLKFDPGLSFQLYQMLFQPLESKIQHKKLICIVPDDFLMGFPFELLVRDPNVNSRSSSSILYDNYSHLDYLIKHYAISYNYSATVLLLAKEWERASKRLGHRLLTLSEPLASPLTGDTMAEMRRQMIWLPENNIYSSEEIKRVSRLLFRHDNLKKAQATKSSFLEIGRKYRWIHLALPGILDNSNLLNSGLLFSPEKGDSSGLSGWLTIDELVPGTFLADLLTLSATQLSSFTGEGNPGVAGLPQAFLFSGVKSVMFSLWPVNSISTSQFMSKFYWELKYKRQTNVQALQEAKVASLKDSFIYDGTEISRAHPYFWATFQLVGNPNIRPPSPTKVPPWGVIAFVYVCVILGALYITRKTLPARKR